MKLKDKLKERFPTLRGPKAAILAAVVIVILLILLDNARAHDWYDASCCSDQDCAPIPTSAVTITNEGFVVSLNGGEHPMVSEPWEGTMKHGSELRSKDGRYHVCIYKTSKHMPCLYAPDMLG